MAGMRIGWVQRTVPSLHGLLEEFCRALPHYISDSESAMLFGGITLGAFSPPWSDVDLIVWVKAGEVTPSLEEQAVHLWKHLAQQPLGDAVYLYVAPKTAAGGPMNNAGGGVAGQPRSLRVYRHKSRAMEGYPLSLPDTVSLRRYGVVLWGQDLRSDLPPIPEDWPLVYLHTRVTQLLQAVSSQAHLPLPDATARAKALGADGAMSEPLWCARQLYSLMTGEMLAKEHAAAWYLKRCQEGPLAEALRLIINWRERGEAPEGEIVQAVSLIRPAIHEFLQQALDCLGVGEPDLPPELPSALEVAHSRLSQVTGRT